MEVVPWTYNNPRVDRSKLNLQQFIFKSNIVEIFQDTRKEIDVNKNTAFKLWDGAYLLAKYLEDGRIFHGDFRKRMKCIELGAGCGLVGIVAWLLGATVTLTDLPEALDHLNKCVGKNTVNIKHGESDICTDDIRVTSLTWGQPLDSNLAGLDMDYIFGSDIVYHPRLNLHLVKTLNMLSTKDTVIFISYKPRGLQEENFFSLLDNHGFQCNEVDKEHHPKDFYGSSYKILKITRCSVIT